MRFGVKRQFLSSVKLRVKSCLLPIIPADL